MWLQKGDRRASEQLRRHHETERELAAALCSFATSERPGLYNKLSDEPCHLAPGYPQPPRRNSAHGRDEARRNPVLLDRSLAPVARGAP